MVALDCQWVEMKELKKVVRMVAWMDKLWVAL